MDLLKFAVTTPLMVILPDNSEKTSEIVLVVDANFESWRRVLIQLV